MTMETFPWINFVFMFVSPWIALDKRCRTGDVRRDWWIFHLNLLAGAVNAVGVLVWLFNWITS